MGAIVMSDDLYAKGFSSMEVDLAGTLFHSIAKVSYGMPLEEGWVRGTKKKPQKRTAGQVQPGAGEIEFAELDEAQRFIAALGNAWRMKIWTASFTFWRPGQSTTRLDFLQCRVLDEKGDHSEGVESLHETIPFSYADYKRNGMSPIDE